MNDTAIQVTFVFDLDGTLIDSAKQIFETLEITIGQFQNMSFLSYKLNLHSVIRHLGIPLEEMLSELGFDADIIPVIVTKFRENLEIKILEENSIFDGVIELLKTILDIKCKIAIATNKPSRLTTLVMKQTGLDIFTQQIYTASSFPPKPDPSMLFAIKNDLESNKYVMIGDRCEDMLAGKRAGMYAIGLTQSEHSSEELLRSGADVTFDSIYSLKQGIRGIYEILQNS